MIMYFLFALPGFLLGMYAQSKVKSTFNKYAKTATSRNMTGAEIARALLDAYGLYDVPVEHVPGNLTDHYDPRGKVLRLSDSVYGSNSIAAAGVAAHEMGHALQDAEGYKMLRLRGAMVPSVRIGSKVGPMMLMGGILLLNFGAGGLGQLIAIGGLILFAATALFALVTLPVEFDASKRAKTLLAKEGLMSKSEIKGVDKVLDAAALTYVAAAIQAIGTILFYAMRLFGNRR